LAGWLNMFCFVGFLSEGDALSFISKLCKLFSSVCLLRQFRCLANR
jgi:hypothetical protein